MARPYGRMAKYDRMARLMSAIPSSQNAGRVPSPLSWDDEENNLSQFGAAALPTGRERSTYLTEPRNVSWANTVTNLGRAAHVTQRQLILRYLMLRKH